jgi:hypothetical protein
MVVDHTRCVLFSFLKKILILKMYTSGQPTPRLVVKADGSFLHFDFDRKFTPEEIELNREANPKLSTSVDAYSIYPNTPFRDWKPKLATYDANSDYKTYFSVMPTIPPSQSNIPKCKKLAGFVSSTCKDMPECRKQDDYTSLKKKHDDFMMCRNLRAIQANSNCELTNGWVDPYESKGVDKQNHTLAIKVDAEKALRCRKFGARRLLKDRENMFRLRLFMENFKLQFKDAFKGTKYNIKKLFFAYFLENTIGSVDGLEVPAEKLKMYFVSRKKGEKIFSIASFAFTKKHKENMTSLLQEIKRQDRLMAPEKASDDTYYNPDHLKYNHLPEDEVYPAEYEDGDEDVGDEVTSPPAAAAAGGVPIQEGSDLESDGSDIESDSEETSSTQSDTIEENLRKVKGLESHKENLDKKAKTGKLIASIMNSSLAASFKFTKKDLSTLFETKNDEQFIYDYLSHILKIRDEHHIDILKAYEKLKESLAKEEEEIKKKQESIAKQKAAMDKAFLSAIKKTKEQAAKKAEEDAKKAAEKAAEDAKKAAEDAKKKSRHKKGGVKYKSKKRIPKALRKMSRKKKY